MNILKKVKEKGLAGCIQLVKYGIIKWYNKCMFMVYSKLPINSDCIVLESEGDCCDNAYALFDYMKNNGYLKRYKVTWLVEHPENFNSEINVNYIQKDIWRHWSPETLRILRTCRWYIYDHCNMMSTVKKRKEQKIIYLSHGWGYKASKGTELTNDKSTFDAITVTGELSGMGMSAFWKTSPDKNVITGYPRMDYFFREDDNARKIINTQWHIDNYKKVIFWMPTFRQSKSKMLSENYIVNETGLPLFESVESLKLFNEFLNNHNLLMVFKLHHLQLELPVFNMKFSNIVVIRDEDLQKLGIQLYQLVKYADALVSDYSSISIDYLLINRPIVFTLDDYEQYDKSRGLFPKNAIDYMPGYHVYSINELEKSIEEILQGLDKYSEQRKMVIDKYHTFKDGNSSKRVLDFCGIY